MNASKHKNLSLIDFNDSFIWSARSIHLQQICKISVFSSNLLRHFHSLLLYTIKALEYCRTEVFALHIFSIRKVFLSIGNKKTSHWTRSCENRGWGSLTTFSCFRKPFIKDALCDDALSCSNVTLAEPVAGLRFLKYFFSFRRRLVKLRVYGFAYR